LSITLSGRLEAREKIFRKYGFKIVENADVLKQNPISSASYPTISKNRDALGSVLSTILASAAATAMDQAR